VVVAPRSSLLAFKLEMEKAKSLREIALGVIAQVANF
jgi:hypothetical protein